MEVAGGLAYVVSLATGLQIIDVTNPAVPVEVGSLGTSSLVWDVEVVGAVAYIGDSGLRIVDVSNPALPVELSSIAGVGCNTNFQSADVEVVGELAYLECRAGLTIFDVSDPANPVQIGSINTASGPLFPTPIDLEISGGIAYYSSVHADLQLIDVSDPTLPVSIGVVASPSAVGFEVHGPHAYFID